MDKMEDIAGNMYMGCVGVGLNIHKASAQMGLLHGFWQEQDPFQTLQMSADHIVQMGAPVVDVFFHLCLCLFFILSACLVSFLAESWYLKSLLLCRSGML